jgi:hypothetical protein
MSKNSGVGFGSVVFFTLVGICLLGALVDMSGSGSSGSSSYDSGSSYNTYESSSPYAPSAQTRYEINQMEGTAAEKARAMDAVERFNRAAAARGERPTGL